MPEEQIPPTEDLMREHGVLNRLLLIYEEGMRRIQGGIELPPDAIYDSARLVRDFVQDYHEHLEEQWVFPRFRQAGRFLDLVDVLKTQHDRGRAVTDDILRLATPAAMADPAKQTELVTDCGLFIRMYRPHEAREDTVLFPALRSIVSPHEFAALGEQFEREEQRRFGEGGFERIVADVARIEQRLGIYDLAQFTP